MAQIFTRDYISGRTGVRQRCPLPILQPGNLRETGISVKLDRDAATFVNDALARTTGFTPFTGENYSRRNSHTASVQQAVLSSVKSLRMGKNVKEDRLATIAKKLNDASLTPEEKSARNRAPFTNAPRNWGAGLLLTYLVGWTVGGPFGAVVTGLGSAAALPLALVIGANYVVNKNSKAIYRQIQESPEERELEGDSCLLPLTATGATMAEGGSGAGAGATMAEGGSGAAEAAEAEAEAAGAEAEADAAVTTARGLGLLAQRAWIESQGAGTGLAGHLTRVAGLPRTANMYRDSAGAGGSPMQRNWGGEGEANASFVSPLGNRVSSVLVRESLDASRRGRLEAAREAAGRPAGGRPAGGRPAGGRPAGGPAGGPLRGRLTILEEEEEEEEEEGGQQNPRQRSRTRNREPPGPGKGPGKGGFRRSRKTKKTRKTRKTRR